MFSEFLYVFKHVSNRGPSSFTLVVFYSHSYLAMIVTFTYPFAKNVRTSNSTLVSNVSVPSTKVCKSLWISIVYKKSSKYTAVHFVSIICDHYPFQCCQTIHIKNVFYHSFCSAQNTSILVSPNCFTCREYYGENINTT